MDERYFDPRWHWMGGRHGRGGFGPPPGGFGPGGFGPGGPPWGDRAWRKGFWKDFMGEPGARADRGAVRYLVLDAIRDQPRHGYEIMQAISERSRDTYKPSPGVVYPTLQMLEELGHAKAVEADGRKVFSITDAGREDLKAHADEVEDFYDRTGGSADWEDQAEMFAELASGVSRLFRLYKRAARRGQLTASAKKAIRAELAGALDRIEQIIEKG